MTSAHSRLRARLQDALHKEFTVGRLLGEGGFATVFRARDNALRRDVAVKVLDLDLQGASPTLAERFLREARTVARLEHPNIVPVYKVGGQGKVLYIIMRHVDGPSLRAMLAKRGRLPVAEAARIARQTSDALHYAHERGVVHRDVKPDNILLDRTGHVFVTDFGIAKAAEEAKSAARGPLTTEGMVLGTPHYMSPEQAAGERLDGRSDLYSLGVVLFHMLAGEPPFDGDSAQAILAQHLTAAPPPMRDVRAEVSGELAAVVDRLLAKAPARRFASGAESSRAMVAALPAAGLDEPSATGAGRGRRAVRWLARAAAGGVLALLAAAGAAFVFWNVASAPPVLNVAAPVPDSVTLQLRRLGALSGAERVEFAFAPAGALAATVFVVTPRRVAVASPAGVRRYLRDSVAYHFDLTLRGRANLLLVGGRRWVDTVYPGLAARAAIEMARGLDGRLRPDPVRGAGLRMTWEMPLWRSAGQRPSRRAERP